MKRALAILLRAVIPGIASGDDGYKVVYDGGSIPNVRAGTGMKLAVRPGCETLQYKLSTSITLVFFLNTLPL